MKVIVCLDDAEGMLFNKRRQSQDRNVKKAIQQLCQGQVLWMNDYSAAVYSEMTAVSVQVASDFLTRAAKGEYCLVETESLAPVADKIETLTVFRWNRKYPADFSLDIRLQDWEKTATVDFSGFSHENITQETYIKKGN